MTGGSLGLAVIGIGFERRWVGGACYADTGR